MVKIFKEDMTVWDYGITVYMETNLGLIYIQTNTPKRVNKRITLRSICCLEIYPETKLHNFTHRAHQIKDPQIFLHKLLMKADPIITGKRTWGIIVKYRRKYRYEIKN